MGCNNSVPDPNLMYGDRTDSNHNKATAPSKNKIHPHKNGTNTNKQKQNGDITKDEPKDELVERMNSSKDLTKKEMKGDLISFNHARVSRQKSLLRQIEKRDKLAQEMSSRAMDDKERFSLSTTRSRGTSRAASPRVSRSGTTGHTMQSTSTANTTLDTQTEEIPSCSSPNKHASADNSQSSQNKNRDSNNSPMLPNHEHSPIIPDPEHQPDHDTVSDNGQTTHGSKSVADHDKPLEKSTNGVTEQTSREQKHNSNVSLSDGEKNVDDSEKSTSNSASALDKDKNEKKKFKKDKTKYHKKKSKKKDKDSESVVATRSDVVSHG